LKITAALEDVKTQSGSAILGEESRILGTRDVGKLFLGYQGPSGLLSDYE